MDLIGFASSERDSQVRYKLLLILKHVARSQVNFDNPHLNSPKRFS